MRRSEIEHGQPVIADHQVLRRIGCGSYGEVWLARNVMGIYRAVKVVYRQSFTDARPFERELAGINRFEPFSRLHEGFMDVLHIGQNEAEGYFYYIMELADDVQTGQHIDPDNYQPRTLSWDLRHRGRLPFEECIQLGLSLSNALKHLHRYGLAHRDIKPSNIIFVNGTPKLADIGLVIGIEETRSFVGTEGYVPPEGPGTPQADIFSLGKVLYEIGTGLDRLLFPQLPANLDAEASSVQFMELNEILLRACQNQALHRYQSAEEMHADLVFVLNGKSVRRLRLLEQRLAKLKKAAVLLALILGVAGALFFQYDRDRKFRAESRQRQIGMRLANGLQAMEAGRFLESLPPLAEAQRLDADAKGTAHRVRLAAVMEQCPKLVQLWRASEELVDGRFSPDGQWVLLAGRSGKIYVKAADSGQDQPLVFGPNYLCDLASFSPDGRQIVVACQNWTATFWNWRTGEQTLLLKHPARVLSAEFNSQGDRVVTAGEDHWARIWDVNTGQMVLEFSDHNQPIDHAVFSHDGTKIVTASEDGSALIWDVKHGKPISSRLTHQSWILYASFSPDDRRVVTAGFDNQARVWEVASSREALPPLEHQDGVSSAQFSPDGQLILTGSWDGTAKLWNANNGRPANPNPVLPHSSRVRRASFHPDGHRLVTVCQDGTARIWDLAAASLSALTFKAGLSADGATFVLQTNQSAWVGRTRVQQIVSKIELAPSSQPGVLNRNGKFFLTVESGNSADKTESNELSVWETATAERFGTVRPFPYALSKTVISDEGEWLAAYASNRVQLYALPSGRAHQAPLVHTGNVSFACFGPQGTHLLTFYRGDACLWEVSQGQLKWRFPHPTILNYAAFSPDGQLVVTCPLDDTLEPCAARVWNLATGQPVGRPLAHRDGVIHAAFSPDSRRVVTASEDFSASIWDLVKGGEPVKLRHRHQVWAAAFSPGGASVLTVSRDCTARLWDASSGEPLCPPLEHSTALSYGAVLAEDVLLTAGPKKTAWLWSLQPDRRPIADLVLLGQVLNGRLTSTDDQADATQSLMAAWRLLKARYPEQFETTPPEIIAWHSQQGQRAKTARHWSAALFHYDHLSVLKPDDPEIARLQEEARLELAKLPK